MYFIYLKSAVISLTLLVFLLLFSLISSTDLTVTIRLGAALATMVTELAVRAASRKEVQATPTHWLTRLLSYWQLIRYT
jgi:hypothetical protein